MAEKRVRQNDDILNRLLQLTFKDTLLEQTIHSFIYTLHLCAKFIQIYVYIHQ